MAGQLCPESDTAQGTRLPIRKFLHLDNPPLSRHTQPAPALGANPPPTTSMPTAQDRAENATPCHDSLSDASAVGARLARSLRAVLVESTGAGNRTALAGKLGVSRVLLSRTLTAIQESSPLETLHRLPGPETLRGLVQAAQECGAPASRVNPALRSIDRFERLIRDTFGTRGALNAAICSTRPSMARRHEYENRFRVFKGMRELRGAQAQTWLSVTLFDLDPGDPTKLCATIIQGFLGLRRLRLDVPIVFTVEALGNPTPTEGALPPPTGGLGLEDFFLNPPAPLIEERLGEQRRFRLDSEALGKRSLTDMLAVARIPLWRSRWLNRERPLSGSFAVTTTPAKHLHCDVLAPPGILGDAPPELFAYLPTAHGAANPNDRSRDIDRMEMPERAERVEGGLERFDVSEVPNYRQMLERLVAGTGHDLSSMRVHRLRIPYPLFGATFVNSFSLPAEPTA